MCEGKILKVTRISVQNLSTVNGWQELSENFSPLMRKGKIFKFTRISMQNLSAVTGCQELFFPCKSF